MKEKRIFDQILKRIAACYAMAGLCWASAFIWRGQSLAFAFFLGGIAAMLASLHTAARVFLQLKKLEDRVKDGELPAQIMSGIDNRLYALFDRYANIVKSEEQRFYSQEVLQKQSQLQVLQSQINPHFLYNTLETLRGRALLEQAEDVADMAEALASLFRYSISKHGDTATIHEELYHLKHYLFIQQQRFPGKFNVSIDVDDNRVRQCRIPRMIIQPLVENAIFHGLETQSGAGEICISLMSTQRNVILTVSDNGCGIEEMKLRALNEMLSCHSSGKENREISGIALDNINRRLKIRFGPSYGVHISSTQGIGTDVELFLPPESELI